MNEDRTNQIKIFDTDLDRILLFFGFGIALVAQFFLPFDGFWVDAVWIVMLCSGTILALRRAKDSDKDSRYMQYGFAGLGFVCLIIFYLSNT